MKNDEIIYSLAIEDIQEVAQDSLNRELSAGEIKTVVEIVEKRIGWYDIVEDAIRETVRN